MKHQNSISFFRSVIFAVAILTGIFGVWILAAELISPRMSYFPANRDDAIALNAVRNAAATAAQVGIVRGDLWTAAAIARAATVMFGTTSNSTEQPSRAEIENMRATADRAAKLSPHDARIWLVLAALDFRLGGNNTQTTEALKLSYYTGPNELSLGPLRLLIAVSSNASSDEDVQNLVPLEIERIVMQRPDLKPAIAIAYRNALPKGREIIESALVETDPKFLATFTGPSRPH
jgi:predicted small integral membrane protein